jgi:hypothetical protein
VGWIPAADGGHGDADGRERGVAACQPSNSRHAGGGAPLGRPARTTLHVREVEQRRHQPVPLRPARGVSELPSTVHSAAEGMSARALGGVEGTPRLQLFWPWWFEVS